MGGHATRGSARERVASVAVTHVAAAAPRQFKSCIKGRKSGDVHKRSVSFDHRRPVRIEYEGEQACPGGPTTQTDCRLLEPCKPKHLGTQNGMVHNMLAHAAAKQRAIDLANGQGLQWTWSDEVQDWEELEPYDGTPIDRRRPLVWSLRHCRTYDDPYGTPTIATHSLYFTVRDFADLSLSEGWDDFEHLGRVPKQLGKVSIAAAGKGVSRRRYKEERPPACNDAKGELAARAPTDLFVQQYLCLDVITPQTVEDAMAAIRRKPISDIKL